jgi:hypothetical protein
MAVIPPVPIEDVSGAQGYLFPAVPTPLQQEVDLSYQIRLDDGALEARAYWWSHPDLGVPPSLSPLTLKLLE